MFWSAPSLSSLDNFQEKDTETPKGIALDKDTDIVDDESGYD